MKLKINRWEFVVDNEDWILDNGAIYQCMTLTHSILCNHYHSKDVPTIMSKSQFNKLRKEGLIVEWKDAPYKSKYITSCKIWRFNVDPYKSLPIIDESLL